ncbi:ABC transporter family protein [Babesia caballi]|uniref:ABC transporter family protein n=1 Tax=Babesia caballi TaxID=5871 RepID=A0AAV4LLN4_BABCB|nr:ABC transporter family protein [Babesia caballi]
MAYNSSATTDEAFSSDALEAESDIYAEASSLEEGNATYFDDKGIFNFLFMRWVPFWARKLTRSLCDAEKVHPLPKADQISYWQPIFSKHVSDGLLRLEKEDAERFARNRASKEAKPYGYILMRALLLTFWRRMSIIVVGMILMNILNVATAVLLKYLLDFISDKGSKLMIITSLVGVIVLAELFHSISEQHLLFYNTRLEHVMESALSLTIFQHGLCHRKSYSSAFEHTGKVDGCKDIIHSYPQGDSRCAHNPLSCPARRYQNRELPPSMYTYFYIDSAHLSHFPEAIIIIIRFLCTFISGMILIRTQIGMKVRTPVLMVLAVIFSMIVIELLNGHLLRHMLQCKDRRITTTSDIVSHLNLLRAMGMEDVGYNTIDNARNDELSILKTRTSLYSINTTLIASLGVAVFLFILLDYIREMKTTELGTTFDVTAPITLYFVINKIVSSVENLPKTIKVIVEARTSYIRIETFLRSCSPNYYQGSLCVPGAPNPNADLSVLYSSSGSLNPDTLVVYENATFSWINTREDTLKCVNDQHAVFMDLNFVLRKGDVKIITGAQGCGKTSFIKSILGEMSLVSGSMVVAPLSTGMPIFYTPQEVWLPGSDIRSIITFGYAFNEEIYWRAVEAVELLSDFNSWADGDSRVISENGYSLSGGQRVRLSLARALYAYLLFSKANESLDNPCCFLMCLDEPFNGLDSTVAKSIFKNLFNRESGLLVRDDVSVVMAASKMNLDICFSGADVENMYTITIHHICDKTLTYGRSVELYIERGDCESADNPHPPSVGLLRKASSLSRLPPDILSLCEVGYITPMKSRYTLYKDPGTPRQPKSVDIECQNRLCVTTSAYWTYFSAMGYLCCGIVFVTLLAANLLEKANSIWVADWCDSIKKMGGMETGHNVVNTSTILEKHEHMAFVITLLSSGYMTCIFVGMVMVVIGNILCCRRLHEFALNSIFNKSSSVLKLKKAIGAVVTFFSYDISYIDEYLSHSFTSALFCILNIVFQFSTICYTIPIASPFPICLFALLYYFVIRTYNRASKKLQVLTLDAVSDINAVYSNVIAGSSLYRSYRKEKQCMKTIYSRSDSYYRVKFMKLSVTTWVMVDAKLSTCAMICLVSSIPIFYGYFAGKKVDIGHLGLGISLCMGFNSVLTSFIFNLTSLEKQMCSMSRYENYFIQNKFSLREKFDSMNETIMSGHFGAGGQKEADVKKRGMLVKRRKNEYRNAMFRKYRSLLSSLFYRPKIDIVDALAYLPEDHTTLRLNNVSVPERVKSDGDPKSYILHGITASANAGNIIGIVGRTGAGKSTLLRVFQNIARKREGEVLLDGRDLNTIPRKVLRHVIGVLPQIPFIFKGWTLRRFLDPRMLYSDSEIMTALECCGLLEFVKQLHDGSGLDTILIPENVQVRGGLYLSPPLLRLSGYNRCNLYCGGSWDCSQRDTTLTGVFSTNQLRLLTFARLVLYRKSYRVLLIDEPPSDNCADKDDSELFETSESAPADVGLPIYDLVKLYFSHCTTFIVAHDKNALKSCSSVWVMQKGMLVNEWSTEEFLSNKSEVTRGTGEA